MTLGNDTAGLASQAAALGQIAGLDLDDRDREILERIFAVSDENRPAESLVWVTGSAARVRRVLVSSCLAWLLLTGERAVLWSAPGPVARADAFDHVRELAGRTALAQQVRSVRSQSGAPEIVSRLGCRLLFRSSSSQSHRGLTVSRLIVEGALSASQMAGLAACVVGQPEAQMLRTA